MAFIQDTKPTSVWTKDGNTPAFWYFSTLTTPLSDVPFCYDTGLVFGYGTFSIDTRPTSSWSIDSKTSSVWENDSNGSGALFFDTWDDSFDLVETSFDDDNAIAGASFTEDTHP